MHITITLSVEDGVKKNTGVKKCVLIALRIKVNIAGTKSTGHI